MATGKEAIMLLTLAVDYTYHAPSLWDYVVLVLLETTCVVFLILTTFWLPISDWWMRRRMSKARRVPVQAEADLSAQVRGRRLEVARSELNTWYSLHARALFEKYMRYSAAWFVVVPT